MMMARFINLLVLFSLLHFALLANTIRSPNVAAASRHHRRRISLPLIHRHSLHHHHLNNPNSEDDITGPLMPSDQTSLFFVNVSIGEPPLRQLLVMDTGSELSWVQSIPCQGCHQALSPTYDPLKSSTYAPEMCSSGRCGEDDYGPIWGSCNSESDDEQCRFEVTYQDEAFSSGVVGTEKFTFVTSDDGPLALTNVLFGCGQKVDDPILHSSGLLGLADGRGSIIWEKGFRKFSYCLGNISDPTYRYNKLIIGDGAMILGDSIPMATDIHNRYVVSLKGIRVAGESMEIANPTGITIMIDSGSTLSYIPSYALEPLKARVINLMDGLINRAPPSERLCFHGDMRSDLQSFPTITLQFSEGFEIELGIESAFITVKDNVFCLAFERSKVPYDNAIGILVQQYFNVGFDLDRMRLSFQRMDCELLVD